MIREGLYSLFEAGMGITIRHSLLEPDTKPYKFITFWNNHSISYFTGIIVFVLIILLEKLINNVKKFLILGSSILLHVRVIYLYLMQIVP